MRTLAIALAILLVSASSHAGPAVDWDAIRAKLAKEPPGTEIEIDKDVFIVMHRTQAKSPLRGGWHRARSTDGNFTVELPSPFNDCAMRAPAKDGVEIHMDGIATTTNQNIAYSAVCMRRVDGSITPETKAITDKTESVGDPIRGWTRILRLGDRVCTLSIEAKGTEPLPPSATIKRFLHSLKSTKKK